MTTTRHWLHVGLSTLLLCLAIVAIVKFNERSELPASVQITTAQIHYSDSAAIPDDSTWVEAALPDDWFRDADSMAFKWYRFQLPTDNAVQKLQALYITDTSRPVLVFLNDELINVEDTPPAVMPRIWNHPQFVAFNQVFTAKGTIDIKLRLPSNQSLSGFLGHVYVGPVDELQSEYDHAFFIKARLPWLTLFAMLLSGIFMLALWLLRRKDSVYGFYAAGAITWTLYSFQYVPSDIPISAYGWELIGMNAMFWFPIIVVFFCNAYLKSPQPRMERGVLVIGVALSAVTLIVDSSAFFWMADYLLPPAAFVLGVYPMGRMLLETLRRKDARQTWLTILAGALTDLLLFNDALVLGHWLPPWPGLFFHYAALPLICVVFSITLLERFVEALIEAESLNISLEDRVDKKTKELEENHHRLRKLEREQYLADERERIMRDMHDGVGGALLSMRAALERDKWSRDEIHIGVCEALDDLYLMIHSLDPYGEDLGMALGATRHRFERRLKQAGLSLGWHLGDIPTIEGLGPQTVLQVIRIIQEAINNAIKHASATQINVHVFAVTRSPQNTVITRIEVKDDGRGLSAEQVGGHGLRNMKQRAATIGADIDITSNDAGTIVRLDLPATLPFSPPFS